MKCSFFLKSYGAFQSVLDFGKVPALQTIELSSDFSFSESLKQEAAPTFGRNDLFLPPNYALC